MTEHGASDVVRNDDAHRFELAIEGDAIAAAYYRLDAKGRLVLTHTEVPSQYEGRGFASALARGLFEIARSRRLTLVLKCPFLRSWYARHPEYREVVDESRGSFAEI
ncbi:GNAT family N-acetyltransferase [Sphingomonas sp. OTU376]|uniref:GNAT family N-acetyltransferase n=1 Tax=Sphingomonas sp. OTU376 TaxID=3043863 RepID=UPI00313CCFC5